MRQTLEEVARQIGEKDQAAETLWERIGKWARTDGLKALLRNTLDRHAFQAYASGGSLVAAMMTQAVYGLQRLIARRCASFSRN